MRKVTLILATLMLTGVLSACSNGMTDVEKQIAEESIVSKSDEISDEIDNSAAMQLEDNTLGYVPEGETFYGVVSVHDVSEQELLDSYGINGGKSKIFLILDASKVDKIVLVKNGEDFFTFDGDEIASLGENSKQIGHVALEVNKSFGSSEFTTADEFTNKLLEDACDDFYGKIWFEDSEGNAKCVVALRLDENSSDINYTSMELKLADGAILVYGKDVDIPVAIESSDNGCSLLYSTDYTGMPPEEEVSY